VPIEHRRDPRVDRGIQSVGYHPQQSVLYPQAGHRQTACIRNISALQRSHSIASADGRWQVLSPVGVEAPGVCGSGESGREGVSDMATIIRAASSRMRVRARLTTSRVTRETS
jgi:hypothetical protein